MKKEAKQVDIFHFLLANYPQSFRRVGDYIHPSDKKRENVYIKKGCNFYYDFRGKHGMTKTSGIKNYGDNIDFMMNFFGISYQKAVLELLGKSHISVEQSSIWVPEEKEVPRDVQFPRRSSGSPDAVTEYLTKTRCIPEDMVGWLLYKGLLYQDVRNNAVFVNYEGDCFEARGTYVGAKKPYKRAGAVYKNRCWYIGNGYGDTCYICEGAIDAISLYILRGRESAIFVSLHGTQNQKIIDRIVKYSKQKVILAVDNDKAGQECRDKNCGLPTLTPPDPYKDWNEMLCDGVGYVAGDMESGYTSSAWSIPA